jgi:hypothetical protein
MMRKILATIAASVVTLATASQAQADVSCLVTVTSVSLTNDGMVAFAFDTGASQLGYWLCSVAGSVTVSDGTGTKTISSAACQAIYSKLLTARASGRPVSLYFVGSGITNCSAIPTTSNPNPFPYSFAF